MDYFDELEQATIKNLKTVAGDYISAKFIEKIIDERIENLSNDYKRVSQLFNNPSLIGGFICKIEELKDLKKILLGGKNND